MGKRATGDALRGHSQTEKTLFKECDNIPSDL